MTSDQGKPAAQGREYQLPAFLAEIADVAGLPAALAIAQVRGGTRAHFPASCPNDHWLVATVGREVADKICEHLKVNHKGGVTELVPLGPTRLYDRARFEALALSDAGMSISDTAREVGVSTRAVELWKAAERKRKAVRRVGRLNVDGGGKYKLARVYNPIQNGLMRHLSGSAVSLDPDRPPPAPDFSNVPALPIVSMAALPQVLADIAQVAGVGACVVVGKMKGAKVLHVTGHAGRDTELAALLGPTSAEKLRAFYQSQHGGEVELLIPTLAHDVFLDVAAWCEAACAAGHLTSDIAGWLGITPAIVDHLCAYMAASGGKRINFRAAFPYFNLPEER